MAFSWWASGLCWLIDEVSAADAPPYFFPPQFVLRPGAGYLPLGPTATLVLLLSPWAQLQRASSVWRISDGVHLPCAVLTSRLTHGVHSQLISVFHSCSWTPLGLLQPAHHLSLSALQGCWLTLRALRGAEYSSVHSQMPSAQPEPALGWEAGIWVLTRCLLPLSLKTFFLLLHLGALPFALEYKTSVLSLLASPFKHLHVSHPKSDLFWSQKINHAAICSQWWLLLARWMSFLPFNYRVWVGQWQYTSITNALKHNFTKLMKGFPGGASSKEPACQCTRYKRHRFDPWVQKIPWSRKWKTTPVFLPGESHGQRSLVGYSP